MQTTLNKALLDSAIKTMKIEANAIISASERLDHNFQHALEILVNRTGKIVVCGMGKSGHIAQKIAATLTSTGSPAIFLHPAEAVHGDLGIYNPGDPTILISKSGATPELIRLIPVIRELESPLIGIVGNPNSFLARELDVVLNSFVECEADPLNIAPTASAVVSLAIGDAIASALIIANNFSPQDFAKFHPGGQLGRVLSLQVADVMHSVDRVACVHPSATLKDLVVAMTEFPLGAACVLGEKSRLLGIVTDGDVRRALRKYDDIRPLLVEQLMMAPPITVSPDSSLSQAIVIMENRTSQISVLPVINEGGTCLGLLRIHDIYQGEVG